MRIATTQYKIELLNWEQYINKIEQLITKTQKENCSLLLLPEYAGIEVNPNNSDDKTFFNELQELVPKFIDFYQTMANKYQIYILPGTILVATEYNKYLNRAYFFSPSGEYGYQDKLQLTDYEKSSGILQKGSEQFLFKTALGLVGITICYDSEFPFYVKNFTDNGATLILVPSYTTSFAGLTRVSISCRARAIENQCYVISAFAIENAEFGSGNKETLFGQAGIYSPADNFFPEDGIISIGVANDNSIIYGDLDFEKIKMVREKGQVHNYEDAKSIIANKTLKTISL